MAYHFLYSINWFVFFHFLDLMTPQMRTQETPEMRTQETPEMRTQETPEMRTQETTEMRTQETTEMRTQETPEMRTHESEERNTPPSLFERLSGASLPVIFQWTRIWLYFFVPKFKPKRISHALGNY